MEVVENANAFGRPSRLPHSLPHSSLSFAPVLRSNGGFISCTMNLSTAPLFGSFLELSKRGSKRAMQKLGRRALAALRRLLTGAICAIAVLALLSVHLRVFPFSGLPGIADPRKLPTYEIKYQRQDTEQSWTQELVPPHFSKPPASSRKSDGANGSSHAVKLWKPPSNRDFVPCTEPGLNYTPPGDSRGYLLVSTNGGLNQMRAGICDMVAVARIINATLVIPELDKRSFWQDTSNFSDVFDEDHFINALANDVRVIRKLPEELATATKAVKYFKSWSGMDYYQNEIASMWDEHKVIRAAKSDSRLANNKLPPEIQKLRCRASYGALRFAPKIEAMGKILVDQMRAHGPYIALHLRYEKDMLAFSGCTHDLSESEAEELKLIRENTSHWKVKEIDPLEQRFKGYCPLTPKEVGIFLAALGYPPNTPIYIAAGEIYGGDSRMAGLRARYPMLMGKELLASAEELQPFMNHASQMAALDYIVSVESDVFIPSYSGNMARAVEGHRRFLGHKKTISPDRKSLVRLFDKIDRGTLKEGKKLSIRIIELHERRQGSPRQRKGPIAGTKGTDRLRSEEPFYVNPLPNCLCHRESPSSNTSQIS